MSISIIVKGGNPLNPIFIFDAELSEKQTDEVEWSQFAIESQANVTEFGWVKPTVHVVTGQVTSSPLGGAWRMSRLTETHRALKDAAARRQLVTLITETLVEDCVITSVVKERGVDEGEAQAIEIQLQTILRPTTETVNIDPSRLKNPRKSTRQLSFKEILANQPKLTSAQQAARGLGPLGFPRETITTNTQPVFQVVP